MKVRRTKNQLIKAIQDAEADGKLEYGSFVSRKSHVDETCVGCAVGNIFMSVVDSNLLSAKAYELDSWILRSAINKGARVDFEDLYGDDNFIGSRDPAGTNKIDPIALNKAITRRDWWSAISHVFERTVSQVIESSSTKNDYKLASKRGADAVVELIENHFPKSLTIDINGFKPAAGVCIVKPRTKKAK